MPLWMAAGFLRYAVRSPLSRGPLQPRALCLYVTYRCNFRCRICGIWESDPAVRGQEWTVEELAEWLRDPFFSKLEFVNLNGGEPGLRADLPDIAEVLLERLPRLRNLTLNTNGVPPARCVALCTRIRDACTRRGVRFGVSVSLHGEGETHDRVVGVPGAFEFVSETIAALKQLRGGPNFFLSVNCVLTPLNVSEAPALRAWSERTEVPVNFTVGEVRERFNNLNMVDAVAFRSGELQEKLVAFLWTLGRQKSPLGHHALRYRELAAMVGRRQPRRQACHYALAGLIVGADGAVYYCKKSIPVGNLRERGVAEILWDDNNLDYRRTQLLRKECPSCLPNTFNAIEVQKDLWKLVRLLW